MRAGNYFILERVWAWDEIMEEKFQKFLPTRVFSRARSCLRFFSKLVHDIFPVSISIHKYVNSLWLQVPAVKVDIRIPLLTFFIGRDGEWVSTSAAVSEPFSPESSVNTVTNISWRLEWFAPRTLKMLCGFEEKNRHCLLQNCKNLNLDEFLVKIRTSPGKCLGFFGC